MLWIIVALILIAGLITTDRKRFAITLFLLFMLVAAHRGFANYGLQVGYDFEAGDVVDVSEPCGRAIPVLLNSERELPDAGSNLRSACARTARTRVLEGLGALALGAVGFVVGWRVIPALRPTPIAEVLNPIPSGEVEVEAKAIEDQAAPPPE